MLEVLPPWICPPLLGLVRKQKVIGHRSDDGPLGLFMDTRRYHSVLSKGSDCKPATTEEITYC